MEPIPPEIFLDAFPPAIAALGHALREAIRLAIPDAIERVRPGWHLVGYDVPFRRAKAYFAYIAPEPGHIHLGLEHGYAVADPDGRLEGEGITRQVRWFTYRPCDSVDAGLVAPYLREAARVACLSREERAALAVSRIG
jgi:hypothetical protein